MVILHWKRERERWLSFTGKKQRERDGHPSLKKNTERDDQPLHEVVSDVVRGRCVRIGG